MHFRGIHRDLDLSHDFCAVLFLLSTSNCQSTRAWIWRGTLFGFYCSQEDSVITWALACCTIRSDFLHGHYISLCYRFANFAKMAMFVAVVTFYSTSWTCCSTGLANFQAFWFLYHCSFFGVADFFVYLPSRYVWFLLLLRRLILYLKQCIFFWLLPSQ